MCTLSGIILLLEVKEVAWQVDKVKFEIRCQHLETGGNSESAVAIVNYLNLAQALLLSKILDEKFKDAVLSQFLTEELLEVHEGSSRDDFVDGQDFFGYKVGFEGSGWRWINSKV